jgi:hypothetical protein
VAITPQGGAGLGLSQYALAPLTFNGQSNPFNSAVNEFALYEGHSEIIPSGQWLISSQKALSYIQYKDLVSGSWRNLFQNPGGSHFLTSDGANYRIVNPTGCVVGAKVTNVGSGYTSAPAVAASAGGATFVAVVGGAISATVTVTGGGGGYTHRPLLLVEPPPAGGIQATAYATVSAGAITSVTVVDQGGGYTAAPRITVVPDPRDTVTSSAVLTTTLTGAGTVVGIICTDYGTVTTALATLSFSGGGGASAAATAIAAFTATGVTTSGTAGVAYGNAQPYLITIAGGVTTAADAATINPSIGSGLFTPRTGFVTGTSTAGGAVQDAGQVVEDGGLFQRVPTAFYTASGTAALPTTTAIGTVNVGGAPDVILMQSV